MSCGTATSCCTASMSEHAAPDARERIHALDWIRGLMILLMAGHHLLYDLAYIYGLPRWLVENPFIRVASPLGAGIFIAMSGVTASVSRSNWKHGLRILLAGAAVTLVTFFYDRSAVIVFGILQFLGVSTLLYAAITPLWKKIPRAIQPAVCGALFALSLLLRSVVTGGAWYLVPFGFPGEGFSTLDYFPLLPWFAVYLFGTWLGGPIFGKRFPDRFYRIRCAFLETCGRQSLWIYLLHQPALMLILSFIFTVLGKM